MGDCASSEGERRICIGAGVQVVRCDAGSGDLLRRNWGL